MPPSLCIPAIICALCSSEHSQYNQTALLSLSVRSQETLSNIPVTSSPQQRCLPHYWCQVCAGAMLPFFGTRVGGIEKRDTCVVCVMGLCTSHLPVLNNWFGLPARQEYTWASFRRLRYLLSFLFANKNDKWDWPYGPNNNITFRMWILTIWTINFPCSSV